MLAMVALSVSRLLILCRSPLDYYGKIKSSFIAVLFQASSVLGPTDLCILYCTPNGSPGVHENRVPVTRVKKEKRAKGYKLRKR